MGKVFVVEPSEEQCEAIAEVLGSVHELRFCRDVHSARAALAEFGPDVLVLDLCDMDGLIFLEELGEDRPRVLVYTAFQAEHMARHLQKISDCLMYAPCNLAQLAQQVDDLLQLDELDPLDNDPALDIVRQLLQRPGRSGYRYLIYAIRLFSRDTHQAVTKELYPAVAKACGSNTACVEKAIRTAIDQAYKERDDTVWRRYFPVGRNGQVIRPTNKAFFSIAVAHIQSKSRKRA